MILIRIKAEILNHIFIYSAAVVGLVRNIYVGLSNTTDGWYDLTSAFYLMAMFFIGLIVNFIFNSYRIIKNKGLIGDNLASLTINYRKDTINIRVTRDLIGMTYAMMVSFLICLWISRAIMGISDGSAISIVMLFGYIPFIVSSGNNSLLDWVFKSKITHE